MMLKKIVLIFAILPGFQLAFSQTVQLDPSFGTGGYVCVPIGEYGGNARSLIVQPDGKILAGGHNYFPGTGNDLAVLRFTADGVLDNTFSGDGVSSFDLGYTEIGHGIALQADGKIVACGYGFGADERDLLLARFDANGDLDPTFAGDGIVTTDIGDHDVWYALIIQPDGKIVAGGYTVSGADSNFVIARYNTDGSFDNTFDGDGIATLSLGTMGDVAYSMALQDDGKIILAGQVFNGTNHDFAIVRYNSDGTLDNTFNGTGIKIADIGQPWECAIGVVIQDDGKIIAGGTDWTSANVDFACTRLNTDGTTDNSYGTAGVALVNVSTYDRMNAMLLQPDGKLIMAGGMGDWSLHYGLVRLNDDGTLDMTFDFNGAVTIDLSSPSELAYGVALQVDKILISGYRQSLTNDLDITVARVMNGPSGVEDFSAQSQINIYPNPTNGLATISIPATMNSASLKLTSLSGQVLLVHENIIAKTFTIDMSSYANGVYFIELNDGSAIERVKIIKE